MNGFLYGAVLQWKLDLRSRTMLIACYAVPLVFFAIMGGIFTSIMPETVDTLIPSMTVFAVSMGALIGLPPSLAEIYRSDIKNAYQANGVPLALGLVLTNISAFVHLLIMSAILYVIAPVAFGAKIPKNPGVHFCGLVILIAVSLGIASIIGLAVKDTANTSMFSILIFLPSIMLSGIMFPADLLPEVFGIAGKLFPAAWGYAFMVENTFTGHNLWPLLAIFVAAVLVCAILLKRIETQ
ncbi:MAG: ABC transporter permease [Oscillibacter sp.]|nr:ABC transporter permease [Oscillibacter sp.]MBD5170286.1 ABC transporter permease [Oscillibacter sp.]